MFIKKYNDTIGNPTRDLPAWGVSVGHTLTSRIKLTLRFGVLISCSLLGCSDDGDLGCSMV